MQVAIAKLISSLKTDKDKVLQVVFTDEVNTVFCCIHVGCLKNYFLGLGTRKCLMCKVVCVVRMEIKERHSNHLALSYDKIVEKTLQVIGCRLKQLADMFSKKCHLFFHLYKIPQILYLIIPRQLIPIHQKSRRRR